MRTKSNPTPFNCLYVSIFLIKLCGYYKNTAFSCLVLSSYDSKEKILPNFRFLEEDFLFANHNISTTLMRKTEAKFVVIEATLSTRTMF